MVSASKADVDKDEVVVEMAVGPRTLTTARQTVTAAIVFSTRTGNHAGEAVQVTHEVHAG